MKKNTYNSNQDPDVKKPYISEETMKAMAAFFMKTSVPRIVAEEKAKREDERNEQSNSKK